MTPHGLRVTAGVLAFLGASSLATVAFAQTKSACFGDAEAAQSLRDAHKLVEAREKLVACAAPICPTAVRNDCTSWLGEVDRIVPSIVLAAKDAAGNDDFDVEVTLDGAAAATHLDGSARSVDPGPHTVEFRWKDGTLVERRVLVGEGQKAVLVSGAHPASGVAPATGPSASTDTHASDPVKTAGYLAAGTGVAAIVVGTVLGVVTVVDVKSAKNACVPNCDDNTSAAAASQMQTAHTLGNASTGLFVAGGALVAGGLIAVFRPTGGAKSAVTVGVAPASSGAGGVMSLGGVW